MKRIILLLLAVLTALPIYADDELYDSYGSTPGNRIRRSRGHERDRDVILSGDGINGIYGRGFNGSAYTTSDRVSIELQANENWSTTANGTKVLIKTTPDGSTTMATVATINSLGLLITPPSSQTIAEGGTITADGCGTTKRITSADPVTTDTTNTFTAPAAANTGCVMFLVNVGTNTITLDTNALFVSAGAANVAVTANDTLTVVSDGSKWYQTSALLAN